MRVGLGGCFTALLAAVSSGKTIDAYKGKLPPYLVENPFASLLDKFPQQFHLVGGPEALGRLPAPMGKPGIYRP